MMMRRLLAIASLLLLAVGPPLALLRVGVTDVSAIGLWSLSDVRPVLVALTAAAWAAWACAACCSSITGDTSPLRLIPQCVASPHSNATTASTPMSRNTSL